jgi:hypothetical protein
MAFEAIGMPFNEKSTHVGRPIPVALRSFDAERESDVTTPFFPRSLQAPH